MKLLTSGTAARLLGAEFRYRTRLISTGDDLVVLGSGDPAFGDSVLLNRMTDASGNVMNIESFLDLWTNAAIDAGIKEVDELIIDDRIFDREYIHPSWPHEQLVNRYCAGVAGLNFHRNVIRFYPRPGTRSADINHVSPATKTLDVTNRIKSDRSNPDSTLVRVSRKHGTNAITLSGNVTVPMRVPIEAPILLDTDDSTAREWDVTALPAVFVIDSAGRIVTRVDGYGPGAMEQLETAVEAALAEQGESTPGDGSQ